MQMVHCFGLWTSIWIQIYLKSRIWEQQYRCNDVGGNIWIIRFNLNKYGYNNLVMRFYFITFPFAG